MPTKSWMIALFMVSMVVLGWSISTPVLKAVPWPVLVAALVGLSFFIWSTRAIFGRMLDMQRGDYLTAKQKYEEAIEKSPRERSWRLLLALAQCEIELGQPEAALAACNRAVEIAPTQWLPYHVRAAAYCDCNKYQDAINDCEKAAANRCPEKYVYAIRAAANFGLKKFDDAIADCDRLQTFYRGKELAVVYVLRSIIDAYSGKFADAIERCTEALKLDPKNALIFNNRGHFYTASRQLEKARTDIRTAESLKVSPRLALHLMCAKAQLAVQEGDARAALTYARKALEQRPNSPCALFAHAVALTKVGDAMIAVAELDRAIAIDPYSGELYWGRFKANEAMSQTDHADQDRQSYERLGYHPYL